MNLKVAFVCLVFVYNVKSQDCGCFGSNYPLPLQNLLLSSPSVANVNIKNCGCPETNCGCIGTLIQAPIVPPCGCYNPAIGLPNPIIGVQSCGCTNSIGACTCGNPVVGNLCGRTTPTVGIATTCGCSDPSVRIVDGCPRCQPVYSYNLPSIGCPSCGYVPCGCGYPLPSLPCSCSGYLPCGYSTPCGCSDSCGCAALTCACGLPTCGCGLPTCGCGLPTCGCGLPTCGCGLPCGSCGCSPCNCVPVNACGCVEVPCGLPKVKTTCTCVTPTIETPCGCIQGKPTCACASTVEVPTCNVPVVPPFAPVIGCPRYLRQVCVQPPYM